MKHEFQVDLLNVRVLPDKEALGRAAADLGEAVMLRAIAERGEAVIILATGASQFEFLHHFSQKKLPWDKVIAFHLDEYVGVSEDHPASFRKYLRDRIIDRVGMGHFYPIHGDAPDIQTEIARLTKIFLRHPVDVAFIGIGENGHIAFNDPPADFGDPASFKVVALDAVSRQQQLKEGWFPTLEDVPQYAVTMTVPAILSARAIVCTVPDLRKAEAVRKTLLMPIQPHVPASVLRRHSNAHLLLDQPAASLISELTS